MAQENSAPVAPQAESVPAPIRAFGARRINLEMRVRLDEADKFTGLPHGTVKRFKFLAAFEQAQPYLGLPAQAAKLVPWLIRQTQDQDWEQGSRPIAWPSAERQAEFLGGISLRAVQLLNRRLWEAGIFVMRDDPQGRRYGNRDKKTGRITKAFGFDLSPLALRYEEFKKIAVDAQIERNRMSALRRRATLARRGINQAVEELGIQGHDSEALRRLHSEAAELVIAARACSRSDELEVAVKALERRRSEAEQMLRDLIKPVETVPMGEKNDAYSTSTTLTPNHLNDTVIASEESSQSEVERAGQTPSAPSRLNHLFPESLNVTPGTLVELAPRLTPYIPARTRDMDWPAIVDAAQYLSAEMGINGTLWARACQLMGREYAAVAIAVVSTRPDGHFTSGPGGYFAGMLRKFENNPADLCLGRTLFRLKDEMWGQDGHAERRKREKARQNAAGAGRAKTGDYQPLPMLPAPAAAQTSDGGFAPVGSLLPQLQAPPALPSRPRASLMPPSADRSTAFGKDWQPSKELLEAEERINAMTAKPAKN
jgi:replication initiation protein RepC